MIVEDQVKSRAAAKAGAVFLGGAAVVAIVGQGMASNSTLTTTLALLIFAFAASLLRACWFFLGARARSKAWLLLPILFNALGLIVMLCLSDKSANKRQA